MELLVEVKAAVIEHGMALGHKDFPSYFQLLGLPSPSESSNTKREKLEDSLSRIPLKGIPEVAQKFLTYICTSPLQRNKLQDLLWANTEGPKISKRYRREIAQTIGSYLYEDGEEFDQLLERLWVLENPNDFTALLGGSSKSLKDEINQHIHRNPGDWDADYLFKRLGAYEVPEKRFCLFLEGLASESVRPDESEQRKFVEAINPSLKECGAQFVETDEHEGYPVFKILPLNISSGEKPKNIIFASSIKPDLRLSDAISNNVEVLTHRDKVLVYDRPVSGEGLTWQELQNWWKEADSISDDDVAKKSLYTRLKKALPKNSPPQLHFFEAYHKYYKLKIPHLPALLPEVWLYWDHKTVRERGADALLHLRMDFLMLLPGYQRVVIEIDGKQHYSNEQGVADPQKYAKIVSSDREMRMLGYDIYRFGGAELANENDAAKIVGPFFDNLFRKFQLTPAQC